MPTINKVEVDRKALWEVLHALHASNSVPILELHALSMFQDSPVYQLKLDWEAHMKKEAGNE